MPAFERAMSLHEEEIAAIVQNNDEPTFENVIEAYDASGEMLDQVSLIFGMVSSAEMNDELLKVQSEIMPRLTAHADKIGMNAELFAKVKSIYDQRNSLSLRDDQKRILEKIYNEFVRSGALLDSEKKERLMQINEALSTNMVKFGQNLLEENKRYELLLSAADLEGLPNGIKDAARKAAEDAGYEDSGCLRCHSPR